MSENMNDGNTNDQPQNKLGIISRDINQEMKEAYLQYSMSVIVGRALPDVRDGLKPVHRRVLFAMSEMNNVHNKPYKKSARVVGDVIGKYHPHGDTAVYDTIVRMAQSFSLRHPLVDGQGNFGSIDGDNAAAMRYTEIRMTRLAEQLLEDIDKETVPFGPNYDDSLQIPLVLPAKIPHLLVNGSTGIAVGMATNIPPHNLGEIIDACILILNNPNAQLAELLQIVHGPDFPSAGQIAGKKGIIEAYKTGRGIIQMKAVAEIETSKGDREHIIVTEIPYQVNKARLIESIADLVREKTIEGISDIRDESSREGMRIVIDLKRGENAHVILNQLFKYTQMQTSYGIIMLALNATQQPQVFGLKGILEAFLAHRRDVIVRRCLFDLKKSEARIHILEGLQKALDQIDAVIKVVRASPDSALAKEQLISQFAFSIAQATAILEMRLQRLTGLERQKIIDEITELSQTIAWLKKVLNSPEEVNKIIATELEEAKELFADPRRTVIVEDAEQIEDEDLIAKEDMVVTITNSGYIKRTTVDDYKSQRRGGKGTKGFETRDEDFVLNIFVANTLTTLLVFTDKGKAYWLKVYKLPEGQKNSKGRSIANVLKLSQNETVKAILPVDEFREDRFVVLITKNGTIKKTPLNAYSNSREAGIIALTIDLDDSLVDAQISDGTNDVFVVTQQGMSIRFDETETRPMGRSARGVRAINLSENDKVVGMLVLDKDSKHSILIITESGFGKRSPADEYRLQGRGGVGLITQKITDRVGAVVGAKYIKGNCDLIVTTNKGQIIRTPANEISIIGRNTQGVSIMKMNDAEMVASIALIASSDESIEVVIPPTDGTVH